MPQDRRYARLRHFHTLSDITDLADLTGTLDATYLRLDCTNDPLSGTLRTEAVMPNLDSTYAFGDRNMRYDGMWGNWIQLLKEMPGSSMVWDIDTQDDGDGESNRGFFMSFESYPSDTDYTGGTQSVSVNKWATAAASTTAPYIPPGFAGVFLGGNSAPGGPDIDVDINGQSSFTWATIHTAFTAGANSSRTIKNGGIGNFVCGVILGGFGANQTDEISVGQGSLVAGNFVGGICGTGFTANATSNIKNTDTTFFSGGSFTWGKADNGDIISSAGGSFAQGYARNGGSITSGGFGSMATGYGQGFAITASGQGSRAHGYTDNNAAITASGDGSFAVGLADTAAIVASADNSAQFGPGTNAGANSLQVGTGPRLSGIPGVPAYTIANGDIWVQSGDIRFQSRNRSVRMTDSGDAAFTVDNGNTDRYYDADATSVAELADVLYTLITELQAKGICL